MTHSAKSIAMVVDDEKSYVKSFVKVHEKWFYDGLKMDLVGFLSAEQAISFLKQNGDGVAVIIVDIRLPTKKAKKLLAFVKSEFPSTRRIGLSGQAARPDIGSMAAAYLYEGYIDKDTELMGTAQVRAEIKRVVESPRDPGVHSQITEAFRRWLEQNPEVRDKKLLCLDPNRGPISMADILSEIEKGTPFGRQQESIIYQLAFDLWRIHNVPQARSATTARK